AAMKQPETRHWGDVSPAPQGFGRFFFASIWMLGVMVGMLPPGRCRAEMLTNAAQVLSLSGEQAEKKLPVRVKGVVTAAEPNWGSKFFVTDATTGVSVGYASNGRPEVGAVLEVEGVTHPGAYAPIITSA